MSSPSTASELPDSRWEWGRSIEERLHTETIGKPLVAFEELTSTNDVLKDFALQGAPEGLTVIARTQTRGRGRRGRIWFSEPGQGIYMSVLLKPRFDVLEDGSLAMLAPVAVAEALESLGVKKVSIKWPNDVLARMRKIAGILVEPRVGGAAMEFAVVGIGLNVRQTIWPEDLKDSATSCLLEGVDVSADQVLLLMLERLDKWYGRMSAGDGAELMAEWTRRGGTDKPPVFN